jgi:hypothetical protein
MNPSANRDAALELIKHELRIFPCDTDREPISKGWQQPPRITSLTITATWKAEHLPALPLGIHGLIVIDADRHEEGKDGVAAFTELCAAHGIDLQSTLVVETPNRGFHFYFRTADSFIGSCGKVAPGIDIRSVGNYVIAPGATLPDGRVYRIVQGSWDTITALPEPLAGLLREKQPSEPSTVPQPVDAALVSDRERAYADAALANDCEKVRTAPKGTRNNTLNTASLSQATMHGWHSTDPCDALLSAALECGLGKTEARKTIESGCEAGKAKPRQRLTDDPIDDAEVTAMICSAFEKLKGKQTASPIVARQWPTPISDDALIGIAGEFVRLVSPQTEGDSNALLIAFLTMMGSMVGRGAYMEISATRHYCNLFSVIVAETSKGRKGTVTDEGKRFARMVDPNFSNRMLGGLSSGEGLIEAVRDARYDDAPVDAAKVPIPKVVDNGVADKRLLVVEGEMGQALQAAGRDGNILSAILRLAWDGHELRTLARSNKNVCREPHISIFGNITLEELQRLLSSTDRANGFANRFLWICATRSKLLPWGGNVDEAALQALAAKASHVIQCASYYGKCGWLPDAAAMWGQEYKRLSAGVSGVAGSMSARAETQILRLALIYAIMDGRNNINVPHLCAALEVWRYCQDSVHYCFGSASGNSIADRIMAMLKAMPEGASLTQISAHFGRNRKKEELQRALDTLKATGKARSESRQTEGRPALVWFALAS